MSLLVEFQRRRVFRVMIGYGIGAFASGDPRYAALLRQMNLPPE